MELLFAVPPVAGRSPTMWGDSPSAASGPPQKRRRPRPALPNHGARVSEAGSGGRT